MKTLEATSNRTHLTRTLMVRAFNQARGWRQAGPAGETMRSIKSHRLPRDFALTCADAPVFPSSCLVVCECPDRGFWLGAWSELLGFGTSQGADRDRHRN